MNHLRIVSPRELAPKALAVLEGSDAVVNLIHLSVALEEVDSSPTPRSAPSGQPPVLLRTPSFGGRWSSGRPRARSSPAASAFMVVATLIAAVGILTDSQILIIGALAELVVNLVSIVAAGVGTLLLQRAAFARRVRQQPARG